MKKIFVWLSLAAATPALPADAQRVGWACEVIDASASYFNKDEPYPALQATQYAAAQALGKPNVFPGAGMNPAAWTTRKNKADAFIHVGFCDSIAVRQIVIAETLHPGTIHTVTGYDYAGKAYDLGEFEPRRLPLPSRTEHVFLDHSIVLKSVRITMSTDVYGESVAIDAIGISDSPVPLQLGLTLPPGLNEKLKSVALSDKVNTGVHEFNPVMMPDQSMLFFSRAFDPGNAGGEHDPEDVWVSKRNPVTGEWERALHMDSVLNTRGPNFVSSIHTRRDTAVFLMGNRYRKNGVAPGVSMVYYHDSTWSDAINLDVPDFHNYSDQGNFFLAANDSVLLMSVMRGDTYGDRDLYASFYHQGKWSVPLNLGPVINTAATDATPYLSDNNKLLYFSSEGHSGLGGADIFVSERLDDTWLHWGPPQNLGTHVNTAQDEFGLTLYSGKGHFIRGDKSDTDIIALQGNVLVKKHRQLKTRIYTLSTDSLPLSCAVTIVPSPIGALQTDSLGQALVDTQPNVIYSIKAEHDGYEIAEKDTLFSDDHDQTEIVLRLKPIEQGFREMMNLEIVYFDFDKSDLKPVFHDYLNRVGQYIIRHNLTVELLGHTDGMGTEGYNQPLSISRATAVRNYLVQQGVPEKQIELYGFGETQPAQPNVTPAGKDNAAGRQMNRRVEFRLKDVTH